MDPIYRMSGRRCRTRIENQSSECPRASEPGYVQSNPRSNNGIPDVLHTFVQLQCDGTPLDLAHGPSLQGVALLNIPFTHGGSNLWGEHHARHRLGKRKKRPDKELSTSSFNSVDLTVAIQGESRQLYYGLAFEKREASFSNNIVDNSPYRRHRRQSHRSNRLGELLTHGSGKDRPSAFRQETRPVQQHHYNHEQTISHADRRGALDAGPLHGELENK